MKIRSIIRRFFRIIVIIQRTIDEQFVNQGKFFLRSALRTTFQATESLIPLISMVLLGIMINDIGFNDFYGHNDFTHRGLSICLNTLRMVMVARFISEWQEKRRFRAHLYSFLLVVLTFYLYHQVYNLLDTPALRGTSFLWKKLTLYGGIVFIFLTEVSNVLRFIYSKSMNASFLFIASFAVIILAGGFLLMLPNATVKGISPVDALFTSASAVCVTGLIVVDTSAAFTTLGKGIILALIQIGGLGIMTFTALLSYLAAGSVSFQSQLALKDMLYSNRMSNVIQLVTRVIIVTLFFEFIGVLLINGSMGDFLAGSRKDRIFFSIFHSVSAFCNAGFSTLSNGLYEEAVRFNYPLHIIIAFLVILGGMGFPILFNVFTVIRLRVINVVRKFLKEPPLETHTRIIQVSSRLAITTSAILLVVGFVTYLLFEQHNTLAQHPTTWGKIVTSFFASVTPRTAGFNTVDLSVINLPTVMVYLLLMWIGASPGSTGGGIKTTTAAVAFLNLGSIVRGKDRTEVFRTQISELSINRSFAVILLSLLILGLSVTLIAVNDADKGLLRIAFEAFSAFSTVGLTLGLTQELSDMSKAVLIVVMFVGRVGALTMLVAFASHVKQLYYRYPTEDIMF